jgi:SSS family solute:Na+ symporter
MGLMSGLDWAVLVGTLALVVSYGAWKTRGASDMASYFRGDYSLRWPTIGLSIMATQASAITFLSTPRGSRTGCGSSSSISVCRWR